MSIQTEELAASLVSVPVHCSTTYTHKVIHGAHESLCIDPGSEVSLVSENAAERFGLQVQDEGTSLPTPISTNIIT